MTLREFLNAANILTSLDKNEVDPMTFETWLTFTADPIKFLRRADDDVAARIWAAIERRTAA